MKNIVIIHLESISNTLLSSYLHLAPTLENLKSKSVSFENFFSGSTSTVMTICELLHGSSSEMNQIDKYNNITVKSNKNLFKILSDNGYSIHGLGYPDWRDENHPIKEMWPDEQSEFKRFGSEQDLVDCFNQATDNKPFAIYFWNLITHLEYSDEYIETSDSYTQLIEKSIEQADKTLAKLLELLETKGLMEETVILAYGDHGDDYWVHDYQAGMTHLIEPYTNLVWCPLYIYDSGLTPEKNFNLAGIRDIKETCLYLLGLKSDKPGDLDGINLFTEKNNVVFSQNLLTKQAFNSYLPINKAYSVVNDDYNLIASNNGLEMYAYRLDPYNKFNILNMFKLNEDGSLEFQNAGLYEFSPYKHLFIKTEKYIDEIKGNFYSLRDLLIERVKLQHSLIPHEERQLADLSYFNSIKYDKDQNAYLFNGNFEEENLSLYKKFKNYKGRLRRKIKGTINELFNFSRRSGKKISKK